MGRPRIQAARDPNIGTSRIDRLAGLAGEITEAEAQRDNGNEGQERTSSGARKRKNMSPVRAERFNGAASGGAEAGTAAAGGEGGQATQAKASRRAVFRVRKTARKSGAALPAAAVPAAEGAQEQEGPSPPKPRRGRPPGSGAQALNGRSPKPEKAPKDPNAPKRPRGRPRKYPLPPGFPNIFPAHATAAARPAADLPPHPREVTRAAQAASAVALVARIAHPTNLALDLTADLALPSAPAVPAQQEQRGAPARVQPVQASPPQLDRQQGLLGAPLGHFPLPAPGDASARLLAGVLDRPPLPRTRGEMGPPPQPPQPLPALPRRVAQQQSEAPQDDRPEDSANSTVGPVHEAVPALPAGHASPVNSIEEWPASRTGTGAAARPGSMWGRPGARRIAHTEMLRFGPSLPLAPRVPQSPTERRAAATRARGSTDEEDASQAGSDAEAWAAAAPALPGRRPDQAAAPTAGQIGNIQATEPLEDGAQPHAAALAGQPNPGESSDTPARLAQDANMAPEGRILPPILKYPGSVQRKRKDHTRSLNVMARSLPDVPRLAGKRRRRPRVPCAPSHNQPKGQAGPHMEMQPETPAGTIAGGHPARPEHNNAAPATDVHEAHETAADDAVQITAATDNHEDGVCPSNTAGIVAGSEGTSAGQAGGRGVGTEPSPKKRLSGQGTYDMPSAQKRLQIENRRAPAAAHKEGCTPLDGPTTEQQLEYACTAPQTTDVEDEGLPGHGTAVEDQAEDDDAGQEDADIDEQPQQQVEDMEEQPEQQVTRAEKHPEEEMLARDTEQAGGETDQEELNRHLLQRLAEEATLVIEAQEAADTAIMAEEGLEHLKMQHKRQEKIFNDHESAVEEVSRALQASAESTKRVQETQDKIAELQEELKRNIAASEAARLHAVATLRKQTTLKEDLETARAEVAQLLQAQPADLAHLSASMAAQMGHVQLLRSASQEAARKLQVVRTDKDRLLHALGRRGAAATAAGNA